MEMQAILVILLTVKLKQVFNSGTLPIITDLNKANQQKQKNLNVVSDKISVTNTQLYER